MFHGRPYGIRAGPTMEEGNSANASQLRSLTINYTLICFISNNIFNCRSRAHLEIALIGPFSLTVHQEVIFLNFMVITIQNNDFYSSILFC